MNINFSDKLLYVLILVGLAFLLGKMSNGKASTYEPIPIVIPANIEKQGTKN